MALCSKLLGDQLTKDVTGGLLSCTAFIQISRYRCMKPFSNGHPARDCRHVVYCIGSNQFQTLRGNHVTYSVTHSSLTADYWQILYRRLYSICYRS